MSIPSGQIRQPDSTTPGQSRAEIDPATKRLSALLQLSQEAREAETPLALGFVFVNETYRLIEYQQAVFWRFGSGGGISVDAVSGIAEIEAQSPYVVWTRRVVKQLSGAEGSHRCRVVDPEELPQRLRSDWDEWLPGPLVWCPFVGRGGGVIGGLLLTRSSAWSEGELVLLDRLGGAYGHAWEALTRHRQGGGLKRMLAGRKALKWLLPAALLAAMFIPVHLSVLAPASVVSLQPVIVSSSIDGVVSEIHVRPSEQVSAGQKLFSLDDSKLASRHEVAQKALAVAEADYLRSTQKAFTDASSKAEVAMRRAVVEQKRAEVAYTESLLQRVDVRAPIGGIAVFSDRNEWLGKPVAVGERVMTVADPAHTGLTLWVPVGDAVNLAPGAAVRVFLNTDPTRPLPAEIEQASYEAQVNENGILAFKARARFTSPDASPRIGLKGTAKIYGEQVSLGYYLFRRPLAAVRQAIGV
jgi:multidrug resistance efflux pump